MPMHWSGIDITNIFGTYSEIPWIFHESDTSKAPKIYVRSADHFVIRQMSLLGYDGGQELRHTLSHATRPT